MREVTVSGTLGAAGASSSSVELDECAPIASCMLTLSTTLTASAVRSTLHVAAEAPRARSESKWRDQAPCTHRGTRTREGRALMRDD